MDEPAAPPAPPLSGPGSRPSAEARVGAFLVDVLLSGLVASLVTAPDLPRNWSVLAFAVQYFVLTLLLGQTVGMRLLGLCVIRLDRPAPIGLWRSAVRTLGVVLLVPALIRDADGRGLHDRLSGTAVVRTSPR